MPATMSRGERGEQGDAGHPGHEGQRGQQGIRGERGAQGIQGVTSRSFRNTVVSIFVFVVASQIVLGAVVQEKNQEMCESRRANVARTNHLYRGLIAIEEDNPFRFTSPKTVQARVDLFTDGLLEPPTCKKWWQP